MPLGSLRITAPLTSKPEWSPLITTGRSVLRNRPVHSSGSVETPHQQLTSTPYSEVSRLSSSSVLICRGVPPWAPHSYDLSLYAVRSVGNFLHISWQSAELPQV